MSRYKAYPEYKESGEEWLGSVPSHWDVIQIKHLSQVKRGASPRPIDDQKYFDDDGEYAWTRIADVTASDTYLLNAPQKLSPLGSSLSVKLEPGELFLSIAGTVGKPCITGIKACIHDGFVYFPDLEIPSKFLFYVFAGEQAYKGLGKFGTQLNLNTDTVGGIKVGCTSRKELENIVQFLDHETAKIDTLIAKQHELIKLLKEKRQAVISHAVTKGLNPNAPMRDSGVEWLGEVPEHWTMSKVSYVGRVLNGSTPDKTNLSYWENGTVPWLASSCLNSDFIYEPTELITVEAYKNSSVELIPSESLLIGMVGQGKTRGTSGILKFDSCINQNMAAIICNEKISVKFLFYIFRAMYDDLRELGRGGNQAALNCEIIGAIRIPLPTVDEQQSIVLSVDKDLEKLEETLELSQSQIDLMQERRTALISAAVTGKIDVRDWQAPSDAAIAA